MNHIARIATRDGLFTARFSERGLAGLEFPAATRMLRNEGRDGAAASPAQRKWTVLTERALHCLLDGRQSAALPPLDWSGHTEFRREVWLALLRIKPGQTRTYAQIAADAGNPSATRAAGGACGANPIPVLVPCHRVVAANGGLGGFSCGLDWKRLLLAREGVSLK